MVVGESGIGKSTLMESLFGIKMPISDPKDRTERLEVVTESIEEDNVILDLKIISTQNYGLAIDKTYCMKEAIKYIDDCFDKFLDMEWGVPRRVGSDPDPRVHLCIYMINPTCRSVRSVDLVAMKQLATKVNLVPVIAKADTVLPNVIEDFKNRITDDLCGYEVLYYMFPTTDEEMITKNEAYGNEIPFAVCGSTKFVDIGGKKVRARQYPWGTVEIENDAHTQFNMFRDSIIRSNMDHLIMSTHDLHYENYRKMKMVEIGYTDNDFDQAPIPLAINVEKQLTALQAEMSGRSQESIKLLMQRINQKKADIKAREEKIEAKYKPRIAEATDTLESLEAERRDLIATLKEIVLDHEPTKKSKKKSGVFRKI